MYRQEKSVCLTDFTCYIRKELLEVSIYLGESEKASICHCIPVYI